MLWRALPFRLLPRMTGRHLLEGCLASRCYHIPQLLQPNTKQAVPSSLTLLKLQWQHDVNMNPTYRRPAVRMHDTLPWSTPEATATACAAPLAWALTAGDASHHCQRCSTARVSNLLLCLQARTHLSAEGDPPQSLPRGCWKPWFPNLKTLIKLSG